MLEKETMGAAGVVKMQRLPLPQQLHDVLRQRAVGQRARRDDDRSIGDFVHPPGHDVNVFPAAQAFRHQARKGLAVDGQGPAGRHGALVGAAHDEGACAPQLFLQQAGRGAQRGAAQRIGADQLGKKAGVVGGRRFMRAHFAQLRLRRRAG